MIAMVMIILTYIYTRAYVYMPRPMKTYSTVFFADVSPSYIQNSPKSRAHLLYGLQILRQIQKTDVPSIKIELDVDFHILLHFTYQISCTSKTRKLVRNLLNANQRLRAIL